MAGEREFRYKPETFWPGDMVEFRGDCRGEVGGNCRPPDYLAPGSFALHFSPVIASSSLPYHFPPVAVANCQLCCCSYQNTVMGFELPTYFRRAHGNSIIEVTSSDFCIRNSSSARASPYLC